MIRSLAVFLASVFTTSLLLLGGASVPGGEKISQSLNSAAEQWFNAPFETKLVTELNELRHPEQRGLLIQLVMQHIAKEARLARHNDVSTRLPVGYEAPLPSFVMKSDRALEALRDNNLVTIKPSQPVFEAGDTGVLNGWAALACFLLAVFWVSLRRG